VPGAGNARETRDSRFSRASPDYPLLADFVAEVFLRHGIQILRVAGATIE
jgi:hypothetical protein